MWECAQTITRGRWCVCGRGGAEAGRAGARRKRRVAQALVMACLEDMHEFYTADERNVVAVHCKAGKGRTGLIISAFLVKAGIAKTASDAIKIFGNQRTSNAHGITIPSQMRYVHYVDAALRQGGLPAAKTYKVRHVRFITVPNFDLGGGCDPYFDVRIAVPKVRGAPGKGHEMRKVFDLKKALGGKVENYQPRHKFVDLDLRDHNLLVAGDVKFVFYDYDRFSADDKVCHFWINTSFILKNYIVLYKPVIDRACKDKDAAEFDPSFAIEIFFEPSAEDIDFSALGEAVDDDKDDPPGEGDEEAEAAAAAAAAADSGAAGAGGAAASGGGGGAAGTA